MQKESVEKGNTSCLPYFRLLTISRTPALERTVSAPLELTEDEMTMATLLPYSSSKTEILAKVSPCLLDSTVLHIPLCESQAQTPSIPHPTATNTPDFSLFSSFSAARRTFTVELVEFDPLRADDEFRPRTTKISP